MKKVSRNWNQASHGYTSISIELWNTQPILLLIKKLCCFCILFPSTFDVGRTITSTQLDNCFHQSLWAQCHPLTTLHYKFIDVIIKLIMFPVRALNVDFDVCLIDWLLNSSLCCFDKVLAWLCSELLPWASCQSPQQGTLKRSGLPKAGRGCTAFNSTERGLN